MSNGAGKGSTRRPTNEVAYRQNYNEIFPDKKFPKVMSDAERHELRSSLGERIPDEKCTKCFTPYTEKDINGGRCLSCGAMIIGG